MKSKLSVLLYIPNIIGYIRILCLYLFYIMEGNYLFLGILLCILSHVLDAVDGFSARLFDQCSEFGYNLDMLIDWVATLVVIFKSFKELGVNHDWLKGILAFFYIIDLVSHWLQVMYAKKKRVSHKSVTTGLFILDHYYQNSYFFMLFLCILNEGFYLMCLYWMRQKILSQFNKIMMSIFGAGFLMKGFVHL